MMYDNIAQSSTAFSHIHCARSSFTGKMDSTALKLKRLREMAVPRITIRAMGDALGMPHSTYAAYEDAKKFKKPILPFDFAKRVAAVLEPLGVDPRDVMELAGLQKGLSEHVALATQLLEVQGSVAAGVWREQSDWPPEQRYSIEVGPNPFPGTERFAVRMEGLSMNRTIPANSDLECLRVSFGVVDPRPGDLVIVQRQNHDLTEMTCKRLDLEDGEWVLRCESFEPEFQERIVLGKPDKSSFIDNEIKVIGIVIGAQQRHFRRRN